MANEKSINLEELMPKISKLKQILKDYNKTKALNLLKELVPEWDSKFKAL